MTFPAMCVLETATGSAQCTTLKRIFSAPLNLITHKLEVAKMFGMKPGCYAVYF